MKLDRIAVGIFQQDLLAARSHLHVIQKTSRSCPQRRDRRVEVLHVKDDSVRSAWLLPSASVLPNPNGTAPGWWVDRADGGVLVALPGPPREMRPMWTDHVLPRLAARGAGVAMISRTLRLAGIGESQLADVLGEELLRAPDPIVATYARNDAVDIRISSRDLPDGGDSTTAVERVAAMADRLVAIVGDHIWAEGATTWADAIGAALAERDEALAIVEIGTGGSLAALLGDRDWLTFSESLATGTATAREHASADALEHLARRGAELGGAAVGIAVRARARGSDTAVSVVVAGPGWTKRERRMVFLGGSNGRLRAALAAADIVLKAIRAH